MELIELSSDDDEEDAEADEKKADGAPPKEKDDVSNRLEWIASEWSEPK